MAAKCIEQKSTFVLMEDTVRKILAKYGVEVTRMQNLFLRESCMRKFQTQELLVAENRVSSAEYLLVEGILHRFNAISEGGNVTTGFYVPGNIITPHFARVSRQRSIFSIAALTPSVVWEIPVGALDKLRHQYRCFAEFGQHVVEQELSRLFLSETVNRTLSAADRLKVFRQQYPGLENLISHQVIASYLGVTQVSLSRLRKQK